MEARKTIERLESAVRSYCRSFPTSFHRSVGAELFDANGRRYIDFFAGAGALNYGHNPPALKKALLAYIAEDGIAHALDMTTEAKAAFLESFERHILAPRDMSYRVMFPGPTGTNAVESALKLARKVTGRTTVVSFTNGFHGMTLGSLAVTGNAAKRAGAGVPLGHTFRAPFDGYWGDDVDTLDQLEQMIDDPSSGLAEPAAFVLETVQAEGGVNVASGSWLRRLASLAERSGALLIVDDIQVGCGRTGPFFSFESWGLEPDIICLSKSLSGFGLPMAINLIKPEHDAWEPGEHNGTFRGNNHAFVTARAAIETFWTDHALSNQVDAKARLVKTRLTELAEAFDLEHRGRGLIQGLRFDDGQIANLITRNCFEQGLVIETAGPSGEVVKVLPPLVIDETLLAEGLDILTRTVREVMTIERRRENTCEQTNTEVRV